MERMRLDSQGSIRDEIAALAHRGLDVRAFSLAATRVLRRTVPFDGVCVLTMDPATLLPTGEVVENGLPPSAMARMAELEITEPDFLKFRQLAAGPLPAAGLSEATGGDLERSARHRELKQPNGFGDELRAVLVGDGGAWAGLTLLRETGGPAFTPRDASVVASLSRPLLEGVRRALLLSDSATPRDGDAGLLLLAEDNEVEVADAGAEAWLAELGATELPGVIGAVAGQARLAAAGGASGQSPASARLRTPSGRWLLVRGSRLGERVAVTLEPLGPHELAPLISEAYGLTERERAITSLVARGRSTEAIARRLHVSPYTVQDHLKAIFDKLGVNSRGALVARVFFEHYAPRLV